MKAPARVAALLLLSSCATTPASEPISGARGLNRIVLSTAEGATGQVLTPSPEIKREDLVEARALLSKARAELEPSEWEPLDRMLAAAEEAWERFEALARKAGKTARVSRGPEGAAEAARLARLGEPVAVEAESTGAARLAEAGGQVARGAEGAAEATRIGSLLRAGPMLGAIIVLLYPSEVANAELTPELRAELELRFTLQAVARAAQQVRRALAEKVEASRRRGRSVSKPVPAAPEVIKFEGAWVQVAGEPPWRPCTHKGSGGPQSSSPLPVADWIRCTFQCGMYEVSYYIFGKRSEDCKEKRSFERAEELAREHHRRGGR